MDVAIPALSGPLYKISPSQKTDFANIPTRPLHHHLDTELGAVVAKIEDVIEALVDTLESGSVMEIQLRSRASNNLRTVRFPGANEKEVKRFTALLLILHTCHDALVNDYIVTKRNIYYQDPGLFGNQQYVDRLVDDIAYTFRVGRDALNIVAAAKGLAAGDLQIAMHDGTVVHCNSDDKGVLLPRTRGINQLDIGSASWLLVIEKEATFRGLASTQFFASASAGQGILVTGKGYPDLATRQFLRLLRQRFPSLPMLAVVDFDPDGIAIMGTYKYGSKSLEHEHAAVVEDLIWLGPKSQHILNMATLSVTGGSPHKLLTPSRTDRRKAVKLLKKLHDNHSDDAHAMTLTHELQVMLFLNVKTEIQTLDDNGHLSSWLDCRLCKVLGHA